MVASLPAASGDRLLSNAAQIYGSVGWVHSVARVPRIESDVRAEYRQGNRIAEADTPLHNREKRYPWTSKEQNRS